MQNYHFLVTFEQCPKEMRLDAFLGACIAEISREKIKKAIQNEQCRVDGLLCSAPSTRIKAGQSIELVLAPTATHIVPEQGDVNVLWHDDVMLICHKPAGLTVHPCPSCTENTFIQRAAGHFPQLLEQEGLRPGIVHRLDKDTSGVIAIALNEKARLALAEDFAERRVHKEYLALVHGVIAEQGEIAEPIGRHPTAKVLMAVVPENRGGRAAHSAWQRLYADPQGVFSLVKVTIFTGRTHQIRVHMAHVGFPLWGDVLYGGLSQKDTATSLAQRQMLHAWHLSLLHPSTREQKDFYCAPPEDFLQCALDLSHSVQKVVLTGLAGCGKSTVLKAFAAQGIPTWSADTVVNSLYAVGGAGHAFLHHRFGSRFVAHAKAELDRTALRLAMQEDAFLRQEVESVIHSMVRENCSAFWQHCTAQRYMLAVAEIPLYLENGWHTKQEAHVVGIACAQEKRHARLQVNRAWTAAQCEGIDAWQWPQDKKMAACQSVISNEGTIAHLQEATQVLIQQLYEGQEQKKQHLTEAFCQLWAEPAL